MDFAWVLDALHRGLKVTRKAWAGDPPMYLYMVTEKKLDGKHIIKRHTGTDHDFEWAPILSTELLDVTDWEEYVEPKKEPAEEALDEETIKALEQLAKIVAEGIAAIFREDGIRRIIQKKCQKQDMDQDLV